MSEGTWETRHIDCLNYDKDCIGKDCAGCPYRDTASDDEEYDGAEYGN
jgi:hypothetical protein